MRLLHFDVEIRSLGNGRYRASARTEGGDGEVEFDDPVSNEAAARFFDVFGRSRRATRKIEPVEVTLAKSVGAALYGALWKGQVAIAFDRIQKTAHEADAGVRVRLRLRDVPELADYPWEMLFDPTEKRFLFASRKRSLVRYLEAPRLIAPLLVDGPLRVLVMAASPVEELELDVEREAGELAYALKPLSDQRRVELTQARGGRLSDLEGMLRNGRFHVFHFIGHGDFDPKENEGCLVFEDPKSGRPVPVRGEKLGHILTEHSSLRLAVLNCCESARSSRKDAYAGVAQTLVLQGMPAVIAMQFEITDKAAIHFAREFYRAISEGLPVDAAVGAARLGIFSADESLEWATPAVFMRTPDGALFTQVAEASAEGEPLPDPASTSGGATPQPKTAETRDSTGMDRFKLAIIMVAALGLLLVFGGLYVWNDDKREYWVHGTGAYEFDGSDRWSEIVGNRRAASLKEASRSRDFVELHDAGRRIRLRLGGDHAAIQDADGGWIRLFEGRWASKGTVPDSQLPAKYAELNSVPYRYTHAGRECLGSFRRQDGGRWVEETKRSVGCLATRYLFNEIGATSTGIVLHDPDRGTLVQVPLDQKEWIQVMGAENATWTNLHQVATVDDPILAPPVITWRCQSPEKAGGLFGDLGTGSNAGLATFANRIEELSPGLRIDLLPAGSVVPPFGVSDAVAKGTLNCGVVSLASVSNLDAARLAELKTIREPTGLPGFAVIINQASFDKLDKRAKAALP